MSGGFVKLDRVMARILSEVDVDSEFTHLYEELLQDGRYKLKELSVKYREQTQKLNEYEKLIPMLYNSR